MKPIRMKEMIHLSNTLDAMRVCKSRPEEIEAQRIALVESMKKLDAEISAAQHRCSARRITASDIINSIVTVIEPHLYNISNKQDSIGTKASVDCHAQKFPNAYKGIPESTHFDLEFTKNGWEVVAIARRPTRRTNEVRFTLTEATKSKLTERMSYI